MEPVGKNNSGTSSPVARLAEMPLFPLPMVLFPHMPLPLHIYEERYKEMIDRCVRESAPFGIVLATGTGVGTGVGTGTVETSAIGCSARIARVERLPDGKMNIEVIGENRFRILDTHERRAYRTGLTEVFEDRPGNPPALAPLVDEVQRLLRDFQARRLALEGRSMPHCELPSDPTCLSFIAARELPIDNDEKQSLLSEDSAQERLAAEREILLREVTRLRRAAESRQIVWKRISSEPYAVYICAN